MKNAVVGIPSAPVVEQKLVTDEKSTYRRTGIKGMLHRALPEAAYDRLRSARMALDSSPVGAKLRLAQASALDTVGGNGFLSGLYYAVGSRAYDREHRGTIAARARYLRDVFSHEGSIYVLRRNVHKLEKGLVMRPRRPLFGLGFLQETVQSFDDCAMRYKNGQLKDADTVSWARQVLGVYFQALSAPHALVDQCRAIYEGTLARLDQTDSVERIPFVRPDCDLPSYEAMLQLALHRRSVRWFEQRPVPREVLDKAVVVAGLSPSACNRQPFRFAIFDEPALVQKIGAIPKGTPGWLHNIPCFIVIVGTLEAFDKEKDRHIPYVDGSLAAMSLCFALETQGVSTCCVNWPDIAQTEARMTEALGLAPYERPIMCLAVGYPDKSAKVPYSQKLPLAQLRSYNAVPAEVHTLPRTDVKPA